MPNEVCYQETNSYWLFRRVSEMAESSHQCEENEQKSYEYRLDDFLINLFFETHIFRALNLREKKIMF